MGEEQPPLFEEASQANPMPEDLGEIARRITESAPRVEYDDRTSEAARDQGWGPVDLPSQPLATGEAPPTRPRHKDRLYEMPGQNRNGRSNSPLPTYGETAAGMTPEQIAEQQRLNARGAADARATLPAAPEPVAPKKAQLPHLPPAPPLPPRPKSNP